MIKNKVMICCGQQILKDKTKIRRIGQDIKHTMRLGRGQRDSWFQGLSRNPLLQSRPMATSSLRP
jgi:hypothetical protein